MWKLKDGKGFEFFAMVGPIIVGDLRTLPPGQIEAGIPHMGGLSLLGF
jgi:hypothetical protein